MLYNHQGEVNPSAVGMSRYGKCILEGLCTPSLFGRILQPLSQTGLVPFTFTVEDWYFLRHHPLRNRTATKTSPSLLAGICSSIKGTLTDCTPTKTGHCTKTEVNNTPKSTCLVLICINRLISKACPWTPVTEKGYFSQSSVYVVKLFWLLQGNPLKMFFPRVPWVTIFFRVLKVSIQPVSSTLEVPIPTERQCFHQPLRSANFNETPSIIC